MKPNTCPNPPANLLRRCLATIPESAVRRPERARLSLELPSRSRLKWLSMTAAIPIVTVLAIVPAQHYLNARPRAKQEAIESSRKTTAGVGTIRGFQAVSDFATERSYRTRSRWAGPWKHSIDVWDSKRGHYSGTCDQKDASTDDLRRQSKLETPDGDIYSRSGDKVVKWHPHNLDYADAVPYPDKFHDALDELFDPERMTARLSEYPTNVPKEFQAFVEGRELDVFTGERGQELANVIVCVHRPIHELAQDGAPTIRVRYYRSLKTGLLLGYKATAFWPTTSPAGRAGDTPTGAAPIEIGHGEYHFYGEKDGSDGGKALDKNFITEGAHVDSVSAEQ